MALEPTTQAFINSLSGPPLSQLSPAEAHKVLTDLQSLPIELEDAKIEDTVWPVGPTGETRIRIVRPATAGATEVLPVILYTHGGGWVLGDTITHDRLVREIANGTGDECNSRSAVDPTTTCPRLPSEAEPNTSASAFSSWTASSNPPGAERWAYLWKLTSRVGSSLVTHSLP